MARIGRSNPVQPFASHGFLGNVPANGTLPGVTVVVEPGDRRRKTPPLQAVVVVGTFVPPVVSAPPAPVVIDRADQRNRKPAPDPVAQHGFLASGVGVPGTTPPAPFNLDRADQRNRRLPQDPVAISAANLVTPAAPTVTPPAPFIVPIEERKWILAALPDIGTGFDDVVPPGPSVIEPTRGRRLPLDPFGINPAVLATTPPPGFTAPPPVVIVPPDQRGRFLVVLPAVGQHGFVDPGLGPVGTTPPRAQNLDRVDQRVRYKPQEPLVLSGVLGPGAAPVAPPAAQSTYNFGAFRDRGFMYERDHGKRKYNEAVKRRRRA